MSFMSKAILPDFGRRKSLYLSTTYTRSTMTKTQIRCNDRLEALREYKTKHGHLDVRRQDDASLYWWCQDMRRKDMRRKGELSTQDCITALEAIGFNWRSERKASSQLAKFKRESIPTTNSLETLITNKRDRISFSPLPSWVNSTHATSVANPLEIVDLCVQKVWHVRKIKPQVRI